MFCNASLTPGMTINQGQFLNECAFLQDKTVSKSSSCDKRLVQMSLLINSISYKINYIVNVSQYTIMSCMFNIPNIN